MMVMSSFFSWYKAWARLLCQHDVIVVLVEFRNALVPALVKGEHSSIQTGPFPAGLSDCVASIRSVHKQALAMGIDQSRIIVAGESGGGNLAIASAIRLKRCGQSDILSGVFALAPFIHGDYSAATHLRSVSEYNGVFLTLKQNYRIWYGAEESWENPEAWPILADESTLRGLPRTFISVDECDPLRDEGLLFFRNLQTAGVPTWCHVEPKSIHAGFMTFVHRGITVDTARRMARFAHGDAVNPVSSL